LRLDGGECTFHGRRGNPPRPWLPALSFPTAQLFPISGWLSGRLGAACPRLFPADSLRYLSDEGVPFPGRNRSSLKNKPPPSERRTPFQRIPLKSMTNFPPPCDRRPPFRIDSRSASVMRFATLRFPYPFVLLDASVFFSSPFSGNLGVLPEYELPLMTCADPRSKRSLFPVFHGLPSMSLFRRCAGSFPAWLGWVR